MRFRAKSRVSRFYPRHFCQGTRGTWQGVGNYRRRNFRMRCSRWILKVTEIPCILPRYLYTWQKKKIIIDTRKSSVLLFLYIPSHFKRKIIIITKFRLFYFDTIFFFSFPRKNSKDIHNLFLFSLIFSISLIISNRHCNWLPNCSKRYFPSSRRNTLRNNVRYLFQQIHFPRIASMYVYIHTCIPSISKRRKNISSKLKNRPFVPR